MSMEHRLWFICGWLPVVWTRVPRPDDATSDFIRLRILLNILIAFYLTLWLYRLGLDDLWIWRWRCPMMNDFWYWNICKLIDRYFWTFPKNFERTKFFQSISLGLRQKRRNFWMAEVSLIDRTEIPLSEFQWSQLE